MNAMQQRWVEALESGKYSQGHFRLCRRTADRADVADAADVADVDQYCCLGVACEVLINEGIPDLTRASKGYMYKEVFMDKAIHDELAELLGMSNMLPDVQGQEVSQASFVVMNDSGFSFRDIAKFVREHAQ